MNDSRAPFFGPSSLHSYLVCFEVSLALQFALSSQAKDGVIVVHLIHAIPGTCDVLIHALTQTTKEVLLQEVGPSQCSKLVDPSFEPRCLLLEFKLTASATHHALLPLNF